MSKAGPRPEASCCIRVNIPDRRLWVHYPGAALATRELTSTSTSQRMSAAIARLKTTISIHSPICRTESQRPFSPLVR
jgi:hypothetical protein